jgi:hypothetical protein
MSYADLDRAPLQWQRLLPLFEKLPLWASYCVAIACSVGMGYSLGSSSLDLAGPRQETVTLIGIASGAVLVIFILGWSLRVEERRRAERAERRRLSTEADAVELLDPIDRRVLAALDKIASAKGTDRATLIPAVLVQYIARKSYEASLAEKTGQRKVPSMDLDPSDWAKTLPAWLETLPGSLDVERRVTSRGRGV